MKQSIRLRLLSVVLFVMMVSGAVGCSSISSAESFASLRTDFQSHRQAFDSVVKSAKSHGNLVVAPEYSSTPTGTVPAKHREQYKIFIRDIGAERIEFYGDNINVTMAREGLAVSGTEAGYSHPAHPPDDVLPWSEIDTPHDDIVYFALDDGWYAYVYRF